MQGNLREMKLKKIFGYNKQLEQVNVSHSISKNNFDRNRDTHFFALISLNGFIV